MDNYQLIATVSLVIQIVVLVLLSASIWLKGKKQYRQHGIMMFAAVVLHTIVILVWMIPSFSGLLSAPSTNLLEGFMVVNVVHAITGILAVVLGFWLVVSWHLQLDVKDCFARKTAMRLTLILWLTTLILGVILYLQIIQVF